MAGGFDSLGLMPELLRAIHDLSWYLPTDVQDEAIPLILGGGDVMAAAETGSGKTAAFSLPIIQCVHETLRRKADITVFNESSSLASSAVSAITLTTPRINLDDKDILLIVSSHGLECSSNADKSWVGGRCTHGVKNGKYAYEVTVQGTGIIRVGWSTISSSLILASDIQGFGYGGTSKKSNNNKYEDYGETFGDNDSITCYLDRIENTISFAKNGRHLGAAFHLNSSMAASTLYPAVALKGGSIAINFGNVDGTGFRYPLLPGFGSLSASNSAEVAIPTSAKGYQSSSKRRPLAIILEPARDLAEQVYNAILEMSKYVENPSLKTILLVGSDDAKKQQRSLSQGVDIVVGTIGKLTDLLREKHLDLSQVKFFVLDEADRLIDNQQTLDQIMTLYQSCPVQSELGKERFQVCFFSATLHSPEIKDLATRICYEPTWVDLKGVDSVPDTVHHVIYRIDPIKCGHIMPFSIQSITDQVHLDTHDIHELNSQQIKVIKQQVLLHIIDKFQMSQVMVFCRTNLDCDNLESFLNACSGQPHKKFKGKAETGKEDKYSCCVLAGMRSLQDRRRSLDAFKEGYVRILICTDVAARGIDIQGLPYVINLTLPDIADNYIHRIGRVGRADRMGLAISIVAGEGHKEKVWYHSNCAAKGKNCQNRDLVEKGGCTIWYDEPSLLLAVEERLKMKIPELSDAFELPQEIREKNVEYGETVEMSLDDNNASRMHIASLAPAVKDLAELELIAQNIFLRMNSQK